MRGEWLLVRGVQGDGAPLTNNHSPLTSRMNAICLVIDRLHCGYLGCYGNAWVGMPGIVRLAAESFVRSGTARSFCPLGTTR